jgi:hypothetical protein
MKNSKITLLSVFSAFLVMGFMTTQYGAVGGISVLLITLAYTAGIMLFKGAK